MENLILNPLPTKTWNFLKMNDTRLEQVTVDTTGAIRGDIDEVDIDLSNIKTGLGADMDSLMAEAQVKPFGAVVSEQEDNYRKISIEYENGARVADVLYFDVKDNAKTQVFMDFSSDAGAAGLGALQTKIRIGKNGYFKLVQVKRVGEAFTTLHDIGVEAEDNARFELVQISLSGKQRFEGCYVNLLGNKASMDASVGYRVGGSDKLDMNYVAHHIGKSTESNMNALGSLKENGFKLFRGTIDFVNGCAGSVGSELEEILLIDDDVINQTIPLILCDEEDVAGNHGASIGRPDEELLMYLGARGIDEATAYTMLADAKLFAVSERIENEEIKALVDEYISGEKIEQ